MDLSWSWMSFWRTSKSCLNSRSISRLLSVMRDEPLLLLLLVCCARRRSPLTSVHSGSALLKALDWKKIPRAERRPEGR